MSKDRMTKTEAKALVRELRQHAAKVTDTLTPTPQWIVEQMQETHPGWLPVANLPAGHPRRTEYIEEALNNIDGISAMLREALERGDI